MELLTLDNLFTLAMLTLLQVMMVQTDIVQSRYCRKLMAQNRIEGDSATI